MQRVATIALTVGAIVLSAGAAATDEPPITVNLEKQFKLKQGTAVQLPSPSTEQNVWQYRATSSKEQDFMSQIQDYRILHARSDDGVAIDPAFDPISITVQDESWLIGTDERSRMVATILTDPEDPVDAPAGGGLSGPGTNSLPSNSLSPQGGTPSVSGIGTLVLFLGWFPASATPRTAAVGVGTSYVHFVDFVGYETDQFGREDVRKPITVEYLLILETKDDPKEDRINVYPRISGNKFNVDAKLALDEREHATSFIVHDCRKESQAFTKVKLNDENSPYAATAKSIRKLALQMIDQTGLKTPPPTPKKKI
ncbi:MAG: hypothetical protein AAF432_14135 [Planctomycetota bacterium]